MLGSQVAQAQGAFTHVKSPEEYASATVITMDEQGRRTERVFTTKRGIIASDSLLYPVYVAYTAHLAQEGYKCQRLATGSDFMELIYTKKLLRSRPRKK